LPPQARPPNRYCGQMDFSPECATLRNICLFGTCPYAAAKGLVNAYWCTGMVNCGDVCVSNPPIEIVTGVSPLGVDAGTRTLI